MVCLRDRKDRLGHPVDRQCRTTNPRAASSDMPSRGGGDAAQWLRSALREVGAVRQAHDGNHRYAIGLGRTRGERSRVVIGLSPRCYPKPEPELPFLVSTSVPKAVV